MGIDSKLYNTPAIRGDICGTAVDTSISLDAIADILEILARYVPVDPDKAAERERLVADRIALIRKNVKSLDREFDRLSGWTADDG